ncbi:MAG: hypothetical protein C5B51_13605 [Terriglobia bacterium]|nr:MAG: hypothetical protein C5B51_13605 [Terriglobia bacterium]
MQALHVKLQSFSASYPYPFLRSGKQLTMPVPPYSSLLGNLSACAGRVVGPTETGIAFEFSSRGTAVDLERTRRLRASKNTGRLSTNPEQGLGHREFHVHPVLDLYLTNPSLEDCFLRPMEAPCLGRSQDLAWITLVRRIELERVEHGLLGRTLVPFPNPQTGGKILPPLVDYYLNAEYGYTRRSGQMSRYQFVPAPVPVVATSSFWLYHPSDSATPDHVVYVRDLAGA